MRFRERKYVVGFLNDQHTGSMFAPFPKNFQKSTGEIGGLNEGQEYLGECWENALDVVPALDRLVYLDEMIHGTEYAEEGRFVCEPDRSFQVRAAVKLNKPWRKKLRRHCENRVYCLYGSKYHVGKGWEYTEAFGHQMGSVKDQHGHYARPWLLMNLDGVLLDMAHRQSATIRYRSMPLEREMQFADGLEARTLKGGRDTDVIVRAHVHSPNIYVRGLQTSVGLPGWQMQTTFCSTSITPNRKLSLWLGMFWIEVFPERKGRDQNPVVVHQVLYRHPLLEIEDA